MPANSEALVKVPHLRPEMSASLSEAVSSRDDRIPRNSAIILFDSDVRTGHDRDERNCRRQ